MRWRIYYGDGSTYSGDPFLAPPTNAQGVAFKDRSPVFGKSAYYWRDNDWWACDEAGMWDYLMMHIGPKAVVFGRTLRDDQFYDIKKRMMSEGVG